MLDFTGNVVLNKCLQKDELSRFTRLDKVYTAANDLLLVLAWNFHVKVVNLYNKTEVKSTVDGEIRGVCINDSNEILIRVLHGS